MVIKIKTFIYAEVANDDEGQDLCNTLTLGLEDRIEALPPPAVMVGVVVDSYSKPTEAELAEDGMVE